MLIAELGSVRLQAFATPVEITSLTEDGEALSYSASGSTILATYAVPTQKDAVESETFPNWFAAYTTPRHEKAVVRQLDAHRVESFLPLYSTVQRWKNGCRVKVDRPLFPNYVFVRVRRRDSVKVLRLPGVLSIVSTGREPSALPHSEIEALRAGLPLRQFEPHPYLIAGEKVRITAGSLEGMIGVLMRKKNEFRVVLTLDLIRQSVSVEIGVDEIEPLKP
jgi:transcription antitermination factor NusG